MEPDLNCPNCGEVLAEVNDVSNPFRSEVRQCDTCQRFFHVANLIGIRTRQKAKEVIHP